MSKGMFIPTFDEHMDTENSKVDGTHIMLTTAFGILMETEYKGWGVNEAWSDLQMHATRALVSMGYTVRLEPIVPPTDNE